MKTKKINSVSEFRAAIKSGKHSFLLVLAGGLAYSRKSVYINKRNKFSIFNHIDDSRETLSDKQLFTHCNIGKAINVGAFYVCL